MALSKNGQNFHLNQGVKSSTIYISLPSTCLALYNIPVPDRLPNEATQRLRGHSATFSGAHTMKLFWIAFVVSILAFAAFDFLSQKRLS